MRIEYEFCRLYLPVQRFVCKIVFAITLMIGGMIMTDYLKKASKKRMMPKVIALFAAALLLLAVTKFGIFSLLLGPTTAGETPAEDLMGKYVSFDACDSIAAYASLGSSGSNKLQYYVLTWGDKYISISATEEYYNILDAASEQSQEYYIGDLTELSPMGELKGTVVKLDDELKDFMISGITGIGIPGADTEEEAGAHVVGYTIKLGYVGWLPQTWCLILTALALICIAGAVTLLVLMNSGYYYKNVTAVVGNDKAADADFEASTRHEQICVGKKYIWYFKGAKSYAVPTSSVVWGYCEANPMVVSKYKWPMALYTQDKSYHCINIATKEEVNRILGEIAAHKYPFVEGYTSAKNKMFQNDFQAFFQLAKENKQ